MYRTRLTSPVFACAVSCLLLLSTSTSTVAQDGRFERLEYRQDIAVDLGVGLWAWPLPMDHDGDGDFDLLVSCPDKPFNGTYLFENTGSGKLPVFEPPVRVGPGYTNVRVSLRAGVPTVTRPGEAYPDFHASAFAKPRKLPVAGRVHPDGRKLRANEWSFADFDGDGDSDLVVGVGDWTDYGWDDAYDARGRWVNGPLHGLVYIVPNVGSDAAPRYEGAYSLAAGGERIDVFGMPSPNFADFDGDGDLDLLCGGFRDRLTYFENLGSRTEPRYAGGRELRLEDDRPLRMHLCMIVPVSVDWDSDGDVDLVVGQEDGRVALVENLGATREDGLPAFSAPVFFKQKAKWVKFGALSTPYGFDWDADGDDDLVCGNTAGEIAVIENLDGADPPSLAPPRLLEVDGEPIRIVAGRNGSIQGPAEEKWGYTVLAVADWNADGLPDLVVNSIWGAVVWYPNVGTRAAPELAQPRAVEVAWSGAPPRPSWQWWDPPAGTLSTQWRTSPVVADFTADGLPDLAMLDPEGYLALYGRPERGALALEPPRRAFRSADGAVYDSRHRKVADVDPGTPLRLNNRSAGGSGRRKVAVVDWDGDGKLDLLVNSVNVTWLRNVADGDGEYVFEDRGTVDERVIGSHTSCPTVVDWNRDGLPDIVAGAEDGHFYYLRNPRSDSP